MLQTTRDIKRVASLELQSITDPLMGIYNRRYLEMRLNEEVQRAQRYKFPLSLLLLDIDHFKQINDNFGHHNVDKVLIGIGDILKTTARKADIPARYGGEELVLILPNTSEEDALVLAERLRVTIEHQQFSMEGPNRAEFHSTASIGVSSLREDYRGPDELLKGADWAMYSAKRSGRNRVIVDSHQQK